MTDDLKRMAKAALGWAEVEELAEQLEKQRLWQRPESSEDEVEHEGSD